MATTTTNYGTGTALTQTALDGLVSSTDWTGGWTSDAIDNTTTKAIDYLISGNLQVESTGLTAGTINVFVYSVLDGGTTWPDLFSSGTEGSQGAATLHDTNIRNQLRFGASIATDTTASQNYPILPFSVAALFGGVCPAKFAIFIAQSTVAALETTGDPNQVYYQAIKFDSA